MNTNLGKDLTVGNAGTLLMGMWIPLVIGSMFTMGYSIINAIWVGQILGSKEMAGVAVTMPIVQLMGALATGIMTAVSILIARYYGAKEEGQMKNIVFHGWVITAMLIILVTGGGILFCDPLLRAMGTPEDVLTLTSGYMKIIFASFIFSTILSLVSSILRGVGDTKKPMVFVLLSIIINAILDPLLIMGVGPIPQMGLNGAGLASLLSSAIAGVFAYGYMKKQSGNLIKIAISKLDFAVIRDILKIGIPTAGQQLLFAFGAIFMVVFVNTYGVSAIAAYGAVTRIEYFVILPGIAMSMALSIIIGQNLGAGKTERVKEFFKSGIIIGSVYTILVSILTIVFPKALMSMFLDDPTALEVGIDYFRMVGFSYILISIMFVLNGIINGAGKTIISLMLSFVSICLVRIPLAGYLPYTGMGIKGIWAAFMIGSAVSVILFITYYYSGHWKNSTIVNDKPIEQSLN
ncbi:hypothetical protein AMS59_10495 [Lysinibacillus sp. FJAT-14745]|uniref:MATE family efflux transporter n=1 Tax=Lysinibacillus sp. FJAT-14745 TaxID=1704289 RepID=UPI0006ABAB43|nr:MATE family efflux transporter [Lysinibacillus sp. FJAT-14745]KOP78301.1 hypothetical protein AMS59_10495 [Lysinibacillus sp. FJAT-14745]